MSALKITLEKKLTPEQLAEMANAINDIAFFNEEGSDVYEKAGGQALLGDYENFILAMAYEDLTILLKSFKVGRSGSHIWVTQVGVDRVAIIHF